MRVLQTLGKGQMFGEMSFLTRGPRTADVVAIADVELLSFKHALLDKLISTSPTVSSRMLLNLATYISERLHTTTRSLMTLAEGAA